MNTYPSVKYSWEREIIPDQGGRAVDISESGRTRIRLSYDDRYFLVITHPFISTTDRDSIHTFYGNNDTIPFIFTDQVTSDQYEVFFTAQPEEKRHAGPYWDVTVRMYGKPYVAP